MTIKDKQTLITRVAAEQGNPGFQVRRSKRSKRMRMQFTSAGILEVVIPFSMAQHHAHRFVRDNLAWIEKTRQKHHIQPSSLLPTVPDSIKLAAVSETWTVKTEQRLGGKCHLSVEAGKQQIRLYGNRLDARQFNRQASEQLRKWLRQQAKSIFPQRLEKLSQDTGLDYNRLSIRSQKTRWGSCNSRRDISLNDRLLFLSPPVMDYVMMHELCHTRFMNHSSSYWQLVELHCPDYRLYERELSSARAQLPGWVFPA